MNNELRKISVCVCTYKRPSLLSELLDSLAALNLPRIQLEIVIVDNDSTGSAGEVVRRFKSSQTNIPVTYEIETQQGISFARNRTVSLASGEYLAFIDDDEMAVPSWLADLLEVIEKSNADAVFGPVIPIFPEGSPQWIIRSRYFERARFDNGARITSNFTRTSNALVKGEWCRKRQPACFDPNLARSGGEDHDFFKWMEANGAVLSWCDTALVKEIVPKSRQTWQFMLKRRFSSAVIYWRGENRNKSEMKALIEATKGLAGGTLFIILGLVVAPFGRDKLLRCWVKAANGLGRIGALGKSEIMAYGPKP